MKTDKTLKIQPRYQAWLDQTGGGKNWQYISWISGKWAEWRREVGWPENRPLMTQQHDEFTAWLTTREV